MAESCNIGEGNKILTVLSILHSQFVKYVDVKRTLVKQLCSGGALIDFLNNCLAIILENVPSYVQLETFPYKEPFLSMNSVMYYKICKGDGMHH